MGGGAQSYMYSQAGITPLNGQVSDPVDYQQAARSLNLSPQQVRLPPLSCVEQLVRMLKACVVEGGSESC